MELPPEMKAKLEARERAEAAALACKREARERILAGGNRQERRRRNAIQRRKSRALAKVRK